jgi:hypothetical protein
MLKRLVIALLGVSLFGILTSDANAGCIPLSNGQLYCAAWITGSEICTVTIKGGGSCTPGVDCPIVTCSVFGRTDVGNGLCPNPDVLDPDCGLAGTAYCINPASKASKAQGNSFTLDQTLTQLLSDTFECSLKGSKCSASTELDITDAECPDCCVNPNWVLLTFTTPDFNASACVCPTGADPVTGACCADSKRNPDGTCVGTVPATCLNENCTVDLTNYKPGTSLTYTCSSLPSS